MEYIKDVRKSKPLYVFLLLLSLCIIYINKNSASGLVESAFHPVREPITELYFEDHSNLPNKIIMDETYEVTYTIRNLEQKNTKYTSIVYLQTDLGKTVLNQAVYEIEDGSSQIFKHKFNLSELTDTRFVVELPDQGQSIYFWMRP